MDESVQKFVNFIYFLIDLIRDLVLSVSGKADKQTTTEESTTAAE
jgi:hypothetical protein